MVHPGSQHLPGNTYLPGIAQIPGTLATKGKVARKLALYPPKKLMEELGLKEGQRVKYTIADKRLVVEPLPDPLDLAIHSKKWAKTSAGELESLSEKEQSELYARHSA